jgi:ribosomal protein S18 acetylase RimI-like enzyme
VNLVIREIRDTDVEPLVELSLLAWKPVFVSFERLLGPDIFPTVYPDWRKSQREGVESVLRNSKQTPTWVAEVDGVPVGYISYRIDVDARTGVVQLLAVHPDRQNRGIGTKLNEWALERMKEAGAELAEVSAGGDESHAPARRSYEKAGYTSLPLVRYYKKL